MIKMVKGTYGLVLPGGGIEAMNSRTGPFVIAGNPEKEAELVAKGYAVFVGNPEESPYKGKSMKELREMAKARGVDAKAVRSKSGLISMLEAADRERSDEF